MLRNIPGIVLPDSGEKLEKIIKFAPVAAF
jgi:hypothetical protein